MYIYKKTWDDKLLKEVKNYTKSLNDIKVINYTKHSKLRLKERGNERILKFLNCKLKLKDKDAFKCTYIDKVYNVTYKVRTKKENLILAFGGNKDLITFSKEER
jgi:hypothetical protein